MTGLPQVHPDDRRLDTEHAEDTAAGNIMILGTLSSEPWGTATAQLQAGEYSSLLAGYAGEWSSMFVTRSDTAERLAELQAKVDALCERIDERPVAYNAQIHALADPRYSLRHPLLVTIEDYDEEVVASIPEFDLYANGVSDAVALMNLKSEIVSTYQRLIELGPDRLGPLARQCLDAMKQVVEPSHA